MNKVAGIVELLDLQQPEGFDHPYSLLLVVMYARSLGGCLLHFSLLSFLSVWQGRHQAARGTSEKGGAHIQNLCRLHSSPLHPEPFGKLRTGSASVKSKPVVSFVEPGGRSQVHRF
jgi:hypothetical protein